MKRKLLAILTAIILFLIPNANFGQVAPTLGTTSSFALFTGAGAFDNLGATIVTGNIGSHTSTPTGFPGPGTVVGNIYNASDGITATAAANVLTAYSDLTQGGTVIGVGLGNGQSLSPGVYQTGAASTLNGILTLNGGGDPNALFIIRIGGAFSTGTFTNVVLTNSADLCNVYWQVNGAFTLGDGSVFRGTLIATGAIHLLEASSLFGRGLSTAGAIDTHNNVVTISSAPATPAAITGTAAQCPALAGQPYSIAALANASTYTWAVPTGWSITSGAGTNSITVTTGAFGNNGNITVTAGNGCGTSAASSLAVTVNPVLAASVSIAAVPLGAICAGTSVTFTATPINGGTTPAYQWKKGGIDISGETNSTYTSATLANTDAITVVMTSNATPCLTLSPATSNTVTMTVTVCGLLNADFTGTPLIICEGSMVTFTNTSTGTTGSTTYNWDFGAGATPAIANTAGPHAVTYSTSGLKTVSLTITDGTSDTETKTNYITVNPQLPTSVSIAAVPPGAICAGTSVNFTATPVNGGTTPVYQWYNGITPVGINLATYSYVPANGDLISVAMTSNAPCATGSPATSAPVTMAVNASTGATTFTSGVISLCQDAADGTYTASAANSTSIVYTVLPAGAGIINAGSGVMNWDAAFSGAATITATSTGLCGITTANTVVTVNLKPAAPTANATLQPTCTVATGTITVTAPAGAGITYSIDGSTYTNTTGIFNLVPSGIYSVTAKSSDGCISTGSSVTIDAQPIPAAPTVILTQPDCTVALGTITVTAPTGVGMTYSINGTDYTNTTGVFTMVPTGIYIVTAKNSDGCISSK